ncbi:MAG: DUF6675 family protein, partial [Spirochaetota bacterium]
MRKNLYAILLKITFLLSLTPPTLLADESTTLLRTVLPNLAPEQLSILIKEKELTRFYFEGGKPLYMPEGGYRAPFSLAMGNLNVTIGVESLYMLDMKGAVISADNPDDMLKLYNLLRSISTLQGIEYYSASRKRNRTLFEESYVVDSFRT